MEEQPQRNQLEQLLDSITGLVGHRARLADDGVTFTFTAPNGKPMPNVMLTHIRNYREDEYEERFHRPYGNGSRGKLSVAETRAEQQAACALWHNFWWAGRESLCEFGLKELSK